jgi:hypothetical protein
VAVSEFLLTQLIMTKGEMTVFMSMSVMILFVIFPLGGIVLAVLLLLALMVGER